MGFLGRSDFTQGRPSTSAVSYEVLATGWNMRGGERDLLLVVLGEVGGVAFADCHAFVELGLRLEPFFKLVVATLFHTLDFFVLEAVHGHGTDEGDVDT